MRTVALDISKFRLNVGDTINIKLIDSVGNDCISSNGYFLNEDIVLDDSVFSIELLENENINIITNYKLTLPSKLHFNFQVPYSQNDTVHDLLSLLRIGCISEVIDKHTKQLDSKFVEKLNLFFTGENPHFSAMQKEVVKLYEYYADEIIEEERTIDVIEMIDNYLATILGD